jgi:acyl carrier protein
MILENEINTILKKIKKKAKLDKKVSLLKQGFDSLDLLTLISKIDSSLKISFNEKNFKDFSKNPTINNLIVVLKKIKKIK